MNTLMTSILVGKMFFHAQWVTSGSSVKSFSGLGPYFEARSCVECHQGFNQGSFENRVFKIDHHKEFGSQLQKKGLFDGGEGVVETHFKEVHGTYGDSTPYTLREPSYTSNKNVKQISARIPPSLFSVGLLDQVSEKTILEFKNKNKDKNKNPINGIFKGRFGYKGEFKNLKDIVEAAFREDIGIESPNEITAKHIQDVVNFLKSQHEKKFQAFVHGPKFKTNIKTNTQTKILDTQKKRQGKKLLFQLDCLQCHREKMKIPGQMISPFTDLLVHVMDDRNENESYRTAPLWGNQYKKFYLHDGRARSIEEAILWHDGEAKKSK
jgi:CxxC motif-containing protein (DUF1111 family)